MNVDDLFGKKTWKHVHAAVFSKTLHKFPKAAHEDVDDAVGTAMLDLVNYWVNLPSSLTDDDPERNYQYAVTRGYWTAAGWMCGRFGQRSSEVSLDYDAEEPLPPELVDQAPLAADLVEDADERERLREFITDLPPAELKQWLGSYLRGESTRAMANNCNISQPSAFHRRRRGINRLREAAREYGIV